MNSRYYFFTIGVASFALIFGCGKQKEEALSKEEIIAEYEASKAAQERVERLEKELEELKSTKSVSNTKVSQQVQTDHQKLIEKQIRDAKEKAEKAEKEAQAAKEARESRGSRRQEREEKRESSQIVINLAKGTRIMVSPSKELSTETSNVNDSWEGTLTEDVTIDGRVAWASGTKVKGLVAQSTPTGRLANGQGALGIKLTDVGGSDIDGGIYVVTGDAKGSRNAKVIGGTAALGALVGVLSDKKNQGDHALGGAAIGAAVGTAIAAGTAKTTITIPASTPITFEVPVDEKIVVKGR